MPYTGDDGVAALCRALSQGMQERGFEIRTFMPRYGCINERRNQLHEVIRLSGMNLVIDGSDHQLIIKVASIPSARIQVYFIDNDDYFARKAMLRDGAGKWFEDNDERAIFFARGVLETVRKLRWEPSVVHCHGWFAAVAPIYLRHVFNDDPLFANLKIVVSLYDDGFEGELDAGFAGKLKGEGVPQKALGWIGKPTYDNMMKMVIDHADGVVIEAKELSGELGEYIAASGKPVLTPEGEKDLDSYQRFYEEIF
jgi:starch synthase